MRRRPKARTLYLFGFNSRTPGGVRLSKVRTLSMRLRFQFTHPGRGATLKSYQDIGNKDVSIHAPREGCDVKVIRPMSVTGRFNSRTPGGVRPKQGTSIPADNVFQFTHPGRGATQIVGMIVAPFVVSIHAPREGCDFILPRDL